MPDRVGAEPATARRALTFSVERSGDLFVRLTLGVQRANPGFNACSIEIVVIAHAIADHLMPATGPRLPIDLEPQLAREATLLGDDLCDDQPAQRLTIGP